MTNPLETTIAELITTDARQATVFEAYGIDYCCAGGVTLAAACEERGIVPDAILRKLKDVTSRGTQAPRNWSTASVVELIDHILETHHAYTREALPAIAARLEKVVDRHGGRHPHLHALEHVYAGLQSELESHMLKEENILFPAAKALAVRDDITGASAAGLLGPIRQMILEHDSAGLALREIRGLTANFAIPEGACATFRTLYAGLEELERDLHEHIHKENHILFPQLMGEA